MVGKGRAIVYEPVKSENKKNYKKKSKANILEYKIDPLAERDALKNPYKYKFPRLK